MASLALFVLLLCSGAPTRGSEPPTPPAQLAPWVKYAQEVRARSHDTCPPHIACVAMQRVVLRGPVRKGSMTIVYYGESFARQARTVSLLGPSDAMAVVSVRFRKGRGSLKLDDAQWHAEVLPGRFELEVEVSFEPQPGVPFWITDNVANVVSQLEGGTLTFDESSDRHGGAMFLRSDQATSKRTERRHTVRVTRVIQVGSAWTFRYHFRVSGLREPTRVELPMLLHESVETTSPELPYSIKDRVLYVTLAPGASSFDVTGYFQKLPKLVKPSVLPFEYWLIEADARHPVQIASAGVEVDPTEVPYATAGPRSRGFYLEESQSIDVTQIPVHVERKRTGTAHARLTYEQTAGDKWVATLNLQPERPPGEDRVSIPTPEPPHYAAVSGTPVRMFQKDGDLSVRAGSGGKLGDVRVQWREPIGGNRWLSVARIELPGQQLRLDSVDVAIKLLPGFSALAVLGADSSRGGLVDGLHIFALLLAAFAAALAHAARFPRWSVAVVVVLFAGLYAVMGFPRTQLILFLVLSATLCRLPDRAMATLSEHRVLHGALRALWVVLALCALIPSALYVQDRIRAALHPWSPESLRDATRATQGVDRFASNVMAESAPAPAAPQRLPMKKAAPTKRDKRNRRELKKAKLEALFAQQQQLDNYGGQGMLSQSLQQMDAKIKHGPPKEKSVRPIAFESPPLPRRWVSCALGSVLPGNAATARLVFVGPVLRGLWIFVECAGVALVFVLMVLAGKRLWTPTEKGGAS